MKHLILIVFLFISYATSSEYNKTDKNDEIYTIDYYNRQDSIKSINNFLDELALKESSNTWDTINKLGYIGKYQFGLAARKTVKVKYFTWRQFRDNPNIWTEDEQDSAVIKLIKVNHQYLEYHFNLDSIICDKIELKQDTSYWYCNGDITEITWSGLYAASHLSGPGNVRKFLQSNGKYNHADANGMTTFDYLKYFSSINVKPII